MYVLEDDSEIQPTEPVETGAPPVVEPPVAAEEVTTEVVEPDEKTAENVVNEPMQDDDAFDPIALVRAALGYEEAFPEGADVLARHVTADRIASLPSDARAVVVNMAARIARMEAERTAKATAEAKARDDAAAERQAAIEAREAELARRQAAFKETTMNPKAIERLRAQIAAKPEKVDPANPEHITALAEAKAAEVALSALEDQRVLNARLAATSARDEAYAKYGIRPGSEESKRVNEIIKETYGDAETVAQAATLALSRGKPENTPLSIALRQFDAERKIKQAEALRATEAADRADAARRVQLTTSARPDVDLSTVWARYLANDPQLDNLSDALSGRLGPDVQNAAKAYRAGRI